MDRLTITAPTQAGTLYFDQLIPAVPVDNRWPLPDYTTPFANRAVNDMVSKNWSALLMYDEMLRQRFPTLNFDVAFSDSSGPSAHCTVASTTTVDPQRQPRQPRTGRAEP